MTLNPCRRCQSPSIAIEPCPDDPWGPSQYSRARCQCGAAGQPSYFFKDCGLDGMGDDEIATLNWNTENPTSSPVIPPEIALHPAIEQSCQEELDREDQLNISDMWAASGQEPHQELFLNTLATTRASAQLITDFVADWCGRPIPDQRPFIHPQVLRDLQTLQELHDMKQSFHAINNLDSQGRPAGGTVTGMGLAITWQAGPLSVDGVRREPNGAFVETVIDAALQRLLHYQESPFNCQENAQAIGHLQAALQALNGRTARRVAAGVEGSHRGN